MTGKCTFKLPKVACLSACFLLLVIAGQHLDLKKEREYGYVEWPAGASWRADGGQVLSGAGQNAVRHLAMMASGHKVDIAKAGRPELRCLPGLGDGLAARIIDRRRLAAGHSAADLGVPAKSWEKLRPWAMVGDNNK